MIMSSTPESIEQTSRHCARTQHVAVGLCASIKPFGLALPNGRLQE